MEIAIKRDTKSKGILGEVSVLKDLISQGWHIALPFGENDPYDIIIHKGDSTRFKRVQVKYTQSKEGRLVVRLRTISNGKVSQIYTSKTVDIMAVYDYTTDSCFYIPSSYFNGHISQLTFRYNPKNAQEVSVLQFLRIDD